MNDPIALKWKNDGNWDGIMRGGRASSTTCVVRETIGNVVYLLSNDGEIVVGDSVQNGIRYYKISAVTTSGTTVRSFTLTIDNNFVPFQMNTQLIILHAKEPAEQELCLETVLNQIGSYTYLVQYLFTNTVNLRDVNAIPPRFYYPTKHTNLEGFLSLIGQTSRAYWDFPAVVTGSDGFPIFIGQLEQVSGVKMWQWVDKKLGYVISVNDSTKRIKTIPVMQMPCGAVLGRNTFSIARKAPAAQRFFLALEPPYPDDLWKGDIIRFYSSAYSMDMWSMSEEPTYAECLVVGVNVPNVQVTLKSGEFKKNDQLYSLTEPEKLYTITALRTLGENYEFTLTPIPPEWVANTVLKKTIADVRNPGKRSMPLIQKATGAFISYEKRPSVRLIVKNGNLNWFSAQIARGTPEVGDIFHVVNSTTLYKIIKIEGDNFYCDPTPPIAFGNSTELEIVRSVMDLSCGIQVPAYGEYYLSMHSTSLLYSNATFLITGRDRDTTDLIYEEGANWSPALVNANYYCTHNIYKKGDYCYNGLQHPRTMAHVTELLYEYQRLITAMWDQIQILSMKITNETSNWINFAQDHLMGDPYWSLYYARL
jgi:hypothetical protein